MKTGTICDRIMPKIPRRQSFTQMKNKKRTVSPDTYFWHISRIACFALAVFSVCILKLTVAAAADRDLASSVGPAIPEMIKNALAGCAAVFFFGFLFELETRTHR